MTSIVLYFPSSNFLNLWQIGTLITFDIFTPPGYPYLQTKFIYWEFLQIRYNSNVWFYLKTISWLYFCCEESFSKSIMKLPNNDFDTDAQSSKRLKWEICKWDKG